MVVSRFGNHRQAQMASTVEFVRFTLYGHGAVVNVDVDFDIVAETSESAGLLIVPFILNSELPEVQLLKHVELLHNQMLIILNRFHFRLAFSFSNDWCSKRLLNYAHFWPSVSVKVTLLVVVAFIHVNSGL